MLDLGICDSRYLLSARRVVHSEPLTSPPAQETSTLCSRWGPVDFVYIDLHARLEYPTWLFASGQRVLSSDQLAAMPGNKVVFMTTCHLPETAFYDIMRSKHTLICGKGKNWGARDRATGAPLLAMWFRRFHKRGWRVETSLRLAKARVFFSSWRKGDRDALQFYIAPPVMGAAGGVL